VTPHPFLRLAAPLLVAGLPVAVEAAEALRLGVGEGSLIRLDRPAATVFVADPDIADIQIAGPRAIFVFGQGAGRTTLFALDEDGAPIAQRDVRVSYDATALRDTLRARFPDARIVVSESPNAVIVEGEVASAADADAVIAAAARALGDPAAVVSRLTVAQPVQVHLRVRVAEVSRSVDQRLGFNWQALLNSGNFAFSLFTGAGILPPGAARVLLPAESYAAVGGGFSSGSADINVIIDALDREGLARTLAEPNLTAMSGETASFTAGGEFPVPVAQDGDTLTVEFKQFGVILDFTPTVLSRDRISLKVRPEVSDLSDNGAIEVNGVSIPALTVRRVETTVEMASGQSLVIGGLLQQTTRDQIDKVPGLGEIPVLGTLFTSSSYRNAETELIVTVTPYLVRPTRPEALAGPLAPRARGRSLESLLVDRAGESGDAAPPRLHGPVGFVF
jgi:pilus assembly protein CpaC